VRKPPKAIARRVKQQPDSIFVWNFGAVYLGFEHQPLGVDEQVALRMPSTFFAGSKPRSVPPTPVVLVVWESTIPALGSGSLPRRTRKSSRSSAFKRSQVPSMRHLLNQS